MLFPEYIQETTHMHFMGNQASKQCKCAQQRSLISHRSKGPSEKMVKIRNAGQAMENREPIYTDGRCVNCREPLWRSVWWFLSHLKNRATEHRPLPITGVYLGKSKNQQDTSTPQFRAALFTKTSTSVHLKYPRKENNG